MKKAVVTILSLLCIIACCFGVAACATEKSVQLDAPENLQIDGRILTWDKVENASGYIVSVQGEETVVQENSFVLLNLVGPATYTVEVAARGEGKFSNSPYAATQLEVEAPVQQAYDEAGFKYTLLEDGTGYELHRGKVKLQGDLYLPDFFNGFPVKRISNSAFSLVSDENTVLIDPFMGGNCNIVTTSFRLPAYLETIGKYAFEGCVKVEEIIIPDSVTSIEKCAFNSCIGLKRVTLPKGLKEIPGSCFKTCSLEELVLPEGLEKIGNGAFWVEKPDNSKSKYMVESYFTSVIIPDTVTEIGYMAFRGCAELADITLSKNLQYVGSYVFGDTAWYNAQPDGFVTIRGDILYGYKGKIEEGTVIEIPSHIKYVVSDALCYQKNLAGLIIPNGVKFIGDGSLGVCKSLTYVKLPSDLEVIPEDTFTGCESLEEIIIPESVKEIGESAFYLCNKLSEVYYEGTEEQWDKIEIGDNWRLTEATIYFYSETKPVTYGNYWHYVNGEVVIWNNDKQ